MLEAWQRHNALDHPYSNPSPPITDVLPAAGLTRPRAAAVAEELRRLILSGESKAGHPACGSADRPALQSVPTPVREAFTGARAAGGLVRHDVQRGVVVFSPSEDDVRENYELRIALEPLATEIAAKTMTGEDLERLLRHDRRTHRRRRPTARVRRLNREFHRAIYAAARRPKLFELIESLRDAYDAWTSVRRRGHLTRSTSSARTPSIRRSPRPSTRGPRSALASSWRRTCASTPSTSESRSADPRSVKVLCARTCPNRCPRPSVTARTPLHCRSFVGGNSFQGTNASSAATRSTASWWATADLADAATVDAAVKAATDAFSTWRRTTGFERGRLLRELARIALERLDALASSMTLEMGKPLDEAQSRKFAQAMRFYAEEAERIGGETIPQRERRLLSVVQKDQRQRRGGRDHALELPGRAGRLEARRRARRRVHDGPERRQVTTGAVQLLAECIRDAGFPPASSTRSTGRERWARCSRGAPAWPRSPSQAPDATGRHDYFKTVTGVTRLDHGAGGSYPMLVSRHADLDLAAAGAMCADQPGRARGRSSLPSTASTSSARLVERLVERVVELSARARRGRRLRAPGRRRRAGDNRGGDPRAHERRTSRTHAEPPRPAAPRAPSAHRPTGSS